jgi:hypothetical protein
MSESDHVRLELRPGSFYGWTMFSGEFDKPYRSPIRVDDIDYRHEGVFQLSFLNIFYAAGVQGMVYLLRPLRWEKTYLLAEQLQGRTPNDRVIIVEQLDKRWMKENVPSLSGELSTFFSEDGQPVAEGFLQLLATAY